MKLPTKISVPAVEIVVGDQIDLWDEDGLARATITAVTRLDEDRILLRTSMGPVQVHPSDKVKIQREVES